MKLSDVIGILLTVLGMLFAIAIPFLLAYLISVSSLPDWFKFWLLKG